MIRLFLAVPVRLYNYERIKQEFSPLLEGRWREEDYLHATIAFFGHQFQQDILIDKLCDFDWSFKPSELTKFDYFSASRVFVATTQNHTLQILYDRLALFLGLEPIELNLHVTMMRVKKINDSDIFSHLLTNPPCETIGILESKIALYKSVLHSDGAHYEIVKEWAL